VEFLSLTPRAPRYLIGAGLMRAGRHGVEAATYDLPLVGKTSIVGTFPPSDNPSTFGPIEKKVQAIETFSLPLFGTTNAMATAAVYQSATAFSVLNQSAMAEAASENAALEVPTLYSEPIGSGERNINDNQH
jgi:hypothetical protein